jgi:2-polyprenyl-3-methyl-5-hydroxy-6-metoxy-1,4-benzoquinol methylase
MPNCRYCEIIKKSAPNYKIHRANWDLGSDFPRCAWHWQLVCDRCGRKISFNGVAWCDKAKEFFCILCAPQHRKKKRKFWAWDYYYEVWCKKCSSYHPALDWIEFKGKHPWQKDPSAFRTLRGLNRNKKFKFYAWMKWAPTELQNPSLKAIQQGWENGAKTWNANYGKYGDAYRRNIFNPTLFPLIGKVKGKKVLDAGCGAGYLSRLLAEKGAMVTGIDLSQKFIDIAKDYEKKKPLDIRYEQGNIANLSRFPSTYFDLVVSVYVLCDVRDGKKAIQEIARVLKNKGRFIFLIEHPCFSWQAGGWERVPKDSQRTEDCCYFKVDNYFRRGTLQSQWGELPILLSFHRTLSDYFRYLIDSGFQLRKLIEPRPLRKSLRRHPREWDREDRIPPVLIIEAVKQKSE